MARTKKPTSTELTEQLKQMEHKNLMLTHYAMDLMAQIKPSAIADQDDFKIELYRPLSAYGGYFIITEKGQNSFEIMDTETTQNYYKNLPHYENYLPLRLCLEYILADQRRIYKGGISAWQPHNAKIIFPN